MYRIEKLKDINRRPLKYNKFHRSVPLYVNKFVQMQKNIVVDCAGWHHLVFAHSGFVKVNQLVAAIKSTQKVVRDVYKSAGLVDAVFNKVICGLSKKSAGSRMGRGKGPATIWGFNVQAGDSLLRIDARVDERVVRRALRYAAQRLSLPVVFR